MALGLDLLGSLVDSPDGAKKFIDLGVEDEYLFAGPVESMAHDFVKSHLTKYGQLPSRETLANYGHGGLPTTTEPPKFYLDKCKDRHIHIVLKRAAQDGGDLLNISKPKDALTVFTDAVFEAKRVQNKKKLVDFSSEGYDIVKQDYTAKLKNVGGTGIGLGWGYLDDMTGGLIGGDVVTFTGRPAQGKTYMMLYCALYMWMVHGIVPMFVSMEMKPLLIVQRLAALFTHKSISSLKKGKFTTAAYLEFMEKLKEIKAMQAHWILDGALTATIDDICLLAQQLQPGAIFIDGAYLVRNANQKLNRWDRMTENAEMIKMNLAEELNIPAIISYQLNRETTKKKQQDVGVENIAYTDAIGQLSSIVLGLFQEESVETLLRRNIQILKGRSGETGDFNINWVFDTPPYMDFTQAVSETKDLNYL